MLVKLMRSIQLALRLDIGILQSSFTQWQTNNESKKSTSGLPNIRLVLNPNLRDKDWLLKISPIAQMLVKHSLSFPIKICLPPKKLSICGNNVNQTLENLQKATRLVKTAIKMERALITKLLEQCFQICSPLFKPAAFMNCIAKLIPTLEFRSILSSTSVNGKTICSSTSLRSWKPQDPKLWVKLRNTMITWQLKTRRPLTSTMQTLLLCLV